MARNNNDGYCECGCGELAPIASRNDTGYGYVKGEPKRFIFGHRAKGEAAPGYKNGRTVTSKGYVKLLMHDHPHANPNGYVYEHRVVVERFLGRYLESHETVHHKNGKKDDNHLENLELRVGQHGKGATHCWHCGVNLTPEFHRG